MPTLVFLMEPLPPFRLDLTVWALRRRTENIIDRWDGEAYHRTLALGDSPIEVAVSSIGSSRAPKLKVSVSGRRVPSRVKPEVEQIVTKTLGTRVDLSRFYRLAARSEKLRALAERFRGMKPPRFPSIFESLVNGIACQQLSLTVGIILLNRLAAACGAAQGAGGHAFPRPSDLLRMNAEDLRGLGFSYSKARALLDLAGLNDDPVRQTLLQMKSVGRWTAEYVMLRGLGRLSVFPGDDVGARHKLRELFGASAAPKGMTYEDVNRIVSVWAPYAGFVYFHLLLSGLEQKGLVSVSDSRRAEL